MKFTVLINQVRALEWGLNSQQAMLFAYVFNAPSWASVIDVGGRSYFHLAKNKIISDMPLLTDKPDTAYRILRQLQVKGVIDLIVNDKKTLISVSEKGRLWDHDRPIDEISTPRKNIRDEEVISEKYPSDVGKISESNSEKFPTYKVISNKTTKSAECQQQEGEKQRIDFAGIQELWNEILGEHIGEVKAVTDQRKKHIRARVTEDGKRLSNDWWERYFRYVSSSDFLTGRGGPNPATGKPWKPNFDWMLNQTNMIKIIEGKYHSE